MEWEHNFFMNHKSKPFLANAHPHFLSAYPQEVVADDGDDDVELASDDAQSSDEEGRPPLEDASAPSAAATPKEEAAPAEEILSSPEPCGEVSELSGRMEELVFGDVESDGHADSGEIASSSGTRDEAGTGSEAMEASQSSKPEKKHVFDEPDTEEPDEERMKRLQLLLANAKRLPTAQILRLIL